jgi:hypothetical protein
MGTMQQMPEEEPRQKAQQEKSDLYSEAQKLYEQAKRRGELQPYEHEVLPEPEASPLPSVESLTEGIAKLLSYEHGFNEVRRDKFKERVFSLFPQHPHDILVTLDNVYAAFDIYRLLDTTPVIDFDEASVPISIGAWFKDMLNAGANTSKEVFSTTEAIAKGFERWAALEKRHRLTGFNEGVALLRDNFSAFISKRLDGLKFWKDAPPPDPTPPDMSLGLFPVTVKCQTDGYRILSSPAYFIDWVYFGAPSSPVTSDMLPGRYIFGTDSIPGCVVCDGAIFRIPADFNPQLIRF